MTQKKSGHSAAFLRSQKDKLIRARVEAVDAMGRARASRSAIDRTNGRDFGDLSSMDAEADLGLSLSEISHDTLREIDEAIRRIEDGTYGVCEISGEPIPEERLKYVPFARCTVNAQKMIERNRHRSRAHGMDFDKLPEEVKDSPD